MNKTLVLSIGCAILGLAFFCLSDVRSQEYPDYLYPEEQPPVIINGDVNADG